MASVSLVALVGLVTPAILGLGLGLGLGFGIVSTWSELGEGILYAVGVINKVELKR